MVQRLAIPLLILICGACVAACLWGFWGFIQYGSSGAPPASKQLAFVIGGVGYLLLLSLSLPLSSWIFGEESSPRGHAGKNLKFTVVALLLCIPLAFIFIGLLLPPVILVASFIGLAISGCVATYGNHALTGTSDA
jgi:hypothetical protein